MSDKNIDKDINRCKELIKEEHSNWIGLTNQEAIENVLKKLEYYRQIHEKVEFVDFTIDYKRELETWKKIAEKLAEEIDIKDSNGMFCEEVSILECTKYHNTYGDDCCKHCVLDRTRNEVENDV